MNPLNGVSLSEHSRRRPLLHCAISILVMMQLGIRTWISMHFQNRVTIRSGGQGVGPVLVRTLTAKAQSRPMREGVTQYCIAPRDRDNRRHEALGRSCPSKIG